MSGDLLFSRRCAVVVDDLLVDGLRVQFSVEKTLTKHPNTADVKITNLSESTRRQMRKKHAKVVLSAGYDDTIARIFSGQARTTDHARQGPEWETHIQCGDGEVQFRFSRVSESYGPGAALGDIITSLGRSMGVDLGNVREQVEAGGFRGNVDQFAQGYVAHGRASTELDRILRTAGFEWSIQDGALQLLKPGQTSKRQAVLLSPETGLVGSPEHGAPDKKGKPSVMKCKSLLQPSIVPGGRVELRSQNVQGQYRVEKVKHTGDTAGGDWYSEVEARPV